MKDSLRALSESECRLLKGALAFRQRQLSFVGRRVLVFSLVVSGALCAVTLVLTNAAWQLVTLSWLAIGGAVSLWAYSIGRRDILPIVRRLESGLRRNQARAVRIQSNEMVAFEENEDEGAVYAFQLDGGQIVIIAGQDFYPSAKFPNTDFSLVHILAEDGSVVERLIAKQGKKLNPSRTISVNVQSRLRMPQHLEMIPGTLDQVEQLLAR